MSRRGNRPSLYLDAILFAVMALLMFVCAPYRIGFKEQIGIFYWSAERISWYLANPAVLASITGDWLTQFYYDNTTGILLTLLLLVILWMGISRLTVLCGADRQHTTSALLPVVIAGAFILWPNYPVSALIGLIIAVWAACLVSHMENLTLRAFAIGVGIPLLFVLAGGHALTFGLVCCFLRGGRVGRNLAALVAGTAVMLVLARLYNLTPIQALIFPAVPGYVLPKTGILMLLPASIVIVCASTYIRNGLITGLVFMAGTIALFATSFSNEPLEFTVQVGTLAYRSDWKEVRNLSSKHPDNTYGLYYRNLSYAREGRLPEALLTCRQNPLGDGLFLSTGQGSSYFSMMYFTDAVIEMGDLSEATDCALLAQTVLPGHTSTRLLRRLAEISVIAGDYPVADKYLDILSRTRRHRVWAEHMRSCMMQDNIPEQYLVWRARTSDTDVFRGIGDMRSSLQTIADNSPYNRVAIDYLLCSYLLSKNLRTFTNLYERYWLDGLDRVLEIPELYQEALLLGADSDESMNNIISRYHISPKVVDKYSRFLSLQFDSGRQPAGIEEFRNTYWYYIMSVDLSGTPR